MPLRRLLPALVGVAGLVLVLGACAEARDQPTTPDPIATAEPVSTAEPVAKPEDVTLNVFAAASLTDAFKEIGEGFAAEHDGVTLQFNFAGSQDLATQINEGAPTDLFASANSRQMDAVVKSGEVVSGTQHTFTRNRLVVVVPNNNAAGLQTLADLAKPGLKVVLAAKAVPAGNYALEFLKKASADPDFTPAYSATVMANVVSFEEDVKAVLGKVALDEADAGIVYVSDLTGAVAEKVGRIDIPDALNVIASYPIAPLARSEHPDLARAFVDYVLSPQGQTVLVRHGFVSTTPMSSP